VGFFFSCGVFKTHDAGTTTSPKKEDVVARVRLYSEQLGNPYGHVARCDSVTFVGVYQAGLRRLGLPPVVDLTLHDYTVQADGQKVYGTGELHRSVEPCHVDGLPSSENDSRSECSQDGVLAYLHERLAAGDTAAILRAIRHAKADDWNWCRGGDVAYTRTLPLAPLMNDIEAKLSGHLRLAQEADALPSLDSFRGNVLFEYVALKAAVFGYVNEVERQAVAGLVKTTPSNLAYKAFFHRFGDGNQGGNLREFLVPFWPSDRLPSREPGQFSWDGGHNAQLYAWAAGWL
jgi:hypothetical protein